MGSPTGMMGSVVVVVVDEVVVVVVVVVDEVVVGGDVVVVGRTVVGGGVVAGGGTVVVGRAVVGGGMVVGTSARTCVVVVMARGAIVGRDGVVDDVDVTDDAGVVDVVDEVEVVDTAVVTPAGSEVIVNVVAAGTPMRQLGSAATTISSCCPLSVAIHVVSIVASVGAPAGDSLWITRPSSEIEIHATPSRPLACAAIETGPSPSSAPLVGWSIQVCVNGPAVADPPERDTPTPTATAMSNASAPRPIIGSGANRGSTGSPLRHRGDDPT
jgi:hypothetical protein